MFPSGGEAAFEFIPNFSVRYSHDQLFNSPTSWSLTVNNEDALRISTQLFYEIWSAWEVGVEVAYITGGVHPLNLRYGSFGSDIRDRAVDIGLLLQYSPTSNLLLQFANYNEFISFETPPATDAFIPSLRVDTSYATLHRGFFPRKGVRFDFTAQGEGFSPFGYQLESRYQQVFSLGTRHALWVDLRAGSARTSVPRKTSFLDYGGICGMPSYLAMTLVDDMVLARIKHLYWINNRVIPLVLQTMVTVGSRGELANEILTPNPYAANLGDPFTSLQQPEVSVSLALGFSVGMVDLLVGTAIDTSLRTAIFLEVR
jgi:hypothetical protein